METKDKGKGKETGHNQENQKWRGEEVQRVPAHQAEDAARRAEGSQPAAARRTDGPAELPSEPQDSGRRRPPSGEAPDEKIEEAAEEHRDRHAGTAGPGRGKL